ncbi:hypothetical protein WSM22_47630 [Cytophagales bacterium WSM2-2]|nr:hypothetical protein WSM22_47630 [Cytophagales bacterium WSM2-2]
MKLTSLFLSIILFLVFTECSKTKQSGETTSNSDSTKATSSEEASKPAEESTSAGSGIVLKGIYATSTKIPAASFSYYNLFDGNKNTYWSTMPGAGPDEGIMLYFDKPLVIDALEITQPGTETNSRITSFTIYTNGQKLTDRDYTNDKITINMSNVYSLFIRLDQLDDMIKGNKEGTVVTSFPSEKTAAISELKILLKGGVKADIVIPKQVKGTITASSTLAPDLSYGVRNLFDSRSEFAWAEGDKGNGIGQSLNLQFQDEQTITGLEVMNGYQRSDKHYSANTRVKTLTLSDETGKQSEVTLNDSQGEQLVSLSTPLKGKNIKIKVKDVYPGASYKDMVISEIKFKNGDAEFILEDNVTESLKNALVKRAKGTMLEKVLDHRIGNEIQEMDGQISSLILRSDYTFVYYMRGWTDSGRDTSTDETIADGNWEIKELSADMAVIRIFGKLMKQSKTQNYYTGETSTDDLQIFQDLLTIDAGGISPQKFLSPLVFAPSQN